MSAASLYPVRPETVANTLTDEATYKAMYQQSVVNPDGFWREQAKRLDWVKPFTAVKGLTQSRRLACSRQKPSGLTTDCWYMAL